MRLSIFLSSLHVSLSLTYYISLSLLLSLSLSLSLTCRGSTFKSVITRHRHTQTHTHTKRGQAIHMTSGTCTGPCRFPAVSRPRSAPPVPSLRSSIPQNQVLIVLTTRLTDQWPIQSTTVHGGSEDLLRPHAPSTEQAPGSGRGGPSDSARSKC